MIHAYNKEYLSDAMENLGEAFDYAVHAHERALRSVQHKSRDTSRQGGVERVLHHGDAHSRGQQKQRQRLQWNTV